MHNAVSLNKTNNLAACAVKRNKHVDAETYFTRTKNSAVCPHLVPRPKRICCCLLSNFTSFHLLAGTLLQIRFFLSCHLPEYFTDLSFFPVHRIEIRLSFREIQSPILKI